MAKNVSGSFCIRCGSNNIEDAKVNITGQYYGEMKVSIETYGINSIAVKGILCLDCGFLELYLKGDIFEDKVKRIVRALRFKYKYWPRKKRVTLEDLSKSAWISERGLTNLLDRVHQEYPYFRKITENGITYLESTQ